MNTVWILWVLVFADGEWRAWEREYTTLAQCEEIAKTMNRYRDQQFITECKPKKGPAG